MRRPSSSRADSSRADSARSRASDARTAFSASLALGDVLARVQQARLAVQLDAFHRQGEDALLSAPGPELRLEPADRALVLQPPHQLVSILRPAPQAQLFGGPAHDLLARVARRPQELLVGVQEAAVEGRDRRRHGVGVEGDRKPPLRRAQRVFGALAFADVADDAGEQVLAADPQLAERHFHEQFPAVAVEAHQLPGLPRNAR